MKTRIAEIITQHSAFEIITHERPDEDAVGSSRALVQALISMGKAASLVYPTPVPDALTFMDAPAADEVNEPEISILVDCSDMGMLKGIIPRGRIVVIDHHRTQGVLGIASWIDPEMSSAAEMIWGLLRELNVPITEMIASNLYMGLFGDTGGFIHANTNAKVFQIAQELCRAGADAPRIASHLKRNKTMAFYRILCTVMNRMVIKDGVFGSYICFEEIQEFAAREEDTSGIVNEMSSLAGSDVVILLKELKEGTIYCSIRSKIKDAALNTARAFGGGGHGLAAGFTINGKPKDIIGEVIKEGLKWIKTE